MDRQNRILEQLKVLTPARIELIDESFKHAGHGKRLGLNEGEKPFETHFNLLIVSDAFQGKSRVERSQMIFRLLDDEFKSGLHALTQSLHTPDEWSRLQNLKGARS